MIKLFKADRHEQAGLQQSERLSLDWQTICAAVSRVWKGDWGNWAKTEFLVFERTPTIRKYYGTDLN
jgi:hypothetical protein